jgi:Xaa-Pro aminopeptidase
MTTRDSEFGRFSVFHYHQKGGFMHCEDHSTPSSELKKRIRSLQEQMIQQKVDGALILQNTDLFYFSGTIQQAHLYVPADAEPVLFVRKSVERARSESRLAQIEALRSPKQIPNLLVEKGMAVPAIMGMELDVLPANLYLSYQKLFEHTKIVDISPLIRLVRAVKSDYEIERIRNAAQRADQVTESVKEFLRDGITEIELAGLIEARARKLGHQGVVRMRLWGSEMFYGHLMAGASAAVPSYLASPTGGTGVSRAVAQGPSHKPIKRHEPVLVDYVFAYQGYLADQTRIFALGDVSDALMKAQEAMLDVQGLVKKAAKAHARAGDIYEAACERVRDLGYEKNFMGTGSQRIRFVGHGVGLELDEYPFLAHGQTLALEEGMTLALEPKLIFPNIGVVGIENTHLVTKEGLEQLTRFEEQIIVL